MKNLTFILCLMLLAGCGEADKPEEVVPAEEVPVEETTE
tara:strand:+ start:468 stop:584 length:117 start_codon:yes stop_codon:yes gene_type:complete